jgi:hypothetical protein
VDTYARLGYNGEMDIQRKFQNKFKDCYPTGGFDPVPFPKSMPDKKVQKVPAILFQITGVRAEVKLNTSKTKKKPKTHDKKAKNNQYIIRWLGIQNSKYVALPEHWVDKNVDQTIIDEAVRRGIASMQGAKNKGAKERFAKLPPGDVRDDDPPEQLRNLELGLNYYYQGKIDNCLMGSFANAVHQMTNSSTARQLLESWSPLNYTSLDRWAKFQEIATRVLVDSVHESNQKLNVSFHKLKKPFQLTMDDSMPIVIQLRGRDGSETHAVTVFRGNIYDSASRYVLKKSEATLQWCSGQYGFERALKTFVLQMESVQKKKRKRH